MLITNCGELFACRPTSGDVHFWLSSEASQGSINRKSPCNGIAFSKGILGREKGRKQGVITARCILQVLSSSFAGFGDQGQAQRRPVDLKECA